MNEIKVSLLHVMHFIINIVLNIYLKPILYLNYCNFKAKVMLYFYFKAIFTFIHTMLKLLGGNFPSILYLFYTYFLLFYCNNFLQCRAILTLFFFSSEHYFKPILHSVISVRQGYFFRIFCFKITALK